MNKRMKKFFISMGFLIVIAYPFSISAQEATVRTTQGTVGFTGTFPSKEKPISSSSQKPIASSGNKELPKTGESNASSMEWIGLGLLNLTAGLVYLRRSR
ncbi:LPXTG cell wall anchor domain-containing protein [Lactococcus allomyrinae]|uniref:LPXTG cell wall anchor domain-containing protein n=1 Tax=Lactococcus allomyrinae TaxID=2419773 RepID=A0A387B7X2_9LACT|nr:LPXTG cell wall anchor domain-containing protein [Lactococcus allomyrinae]AYF99904.1 LPXTG cell wall anchor domain-containing protein [Lactococcus allomyrinae]